MTIDIFIALGISLALNLTFFIFAFTFKSDVFTDITYASTFLLTTLIVMVVNESYNTVSYIILALVATWSIRLGSFLFIRIRKTKVDHRFDKFRDSFWKFGGFWLLQGFTVWIVNMPSYMGLINPVGEFKYVSIIFVLLALFFLSFETIADFQKYNWNNINKGQFINRGLWKISRHPNYFGEYMFWWMIFGFMITNHYAHINLVSIIGPLFIMFTLYKLTGVRILERNSFELFGKDPKYIAYLNKTPCVVPFIGIKGYKKAKLN